MAEFELLLDDFVKFVTLERAKKAVVHCSAGIGRTGTTIALMNMIINIYAQMNNGVQKPEVSVFSTVRRMREKRFGLVQMPEQYFFIYQFLGYWLKKNSLA